LEFLLSFFSDSGLHVVVQEGMGYDFIVGATKVVNGNSILEAIVSNSV
jgi:hypothetical protein